MINPEKRFSFSWKFLFWAPAPFFLWWALQKVPFREIGVLIASLDLSSILLLGCLNIVIFLAISSRWKIILHSLGENVSLLRLASYRLGGFAISYFTPGTQFGGEPLQVFLLMRRYPVSRDDAISSVYLDKLIEVLANFSFLIFGLAITLENGLFKEQIQTPMWFVVIGIGLFPLAHLILLWKGIFPATKFLLFLSKLFPQSSFLLKIIEIVQNAEKRIWVLARQNPDILLKTIGISVIVWILMIIEFHLMWIIVGQPLRLVDTISALTLARLAFLLPLPGGLGALEASQVLAMQVLGYNPAFGLAACLLIRARDVTLGAFGFFISTWAVRVEKVKLI